MQQRIIKVYIENVTLKPDNLETSAIGEYLMLYII